MRANKIAKAIFSIATIRKSMQEISKVVPFSKLYILYPK